VSETAALLSVREVSKHFGGVAAVNGVSFEVNNGAIMALIGPNGAGKTTLFNLISGFSPVTSGAVIWDGRDITRLSAARRVRLGVTRTFQHARVFGELSVRDNIRAACHSVVDKGSFLGDMLGTGRSRANDGVISARADEILESFGFAAIAARQAGELPYGTTKRLGLLIGAATAPKMLMLDEPAAGLNHEEVDVLRGDLMRMRSAGLTVLIVEHHMGLVMDISDSVVVLDAGKKIAEGAPLDIAANPLVVDAYLGA
jgi:branched-chain amino acid transport system ATP-binding protein